MAVAIFGGTFDPVHLGHEQMVRKALEEFNLERVVIVPNANPPHKKDNFITDFSHRYNMLNLAFEQFENVLVSDYERCPDSYSYSVDTMRHFRSVYGEDTYFILGADSFVGIDTWRDYKALLNENQFIVFRRDKDISLLSLTEEYKNKGCRIFLSDMPKVDISSTCVRQAILQGQDADNLVCKKVYDYIRENSLYGGKI